MVYKKKVMGWLFALTSWSQLLSVEASLIPEEKMVSLDVNRLIEEAQMSIDELASMKTKLRLDASDQEALKRFSRFFGSLAVAPMIIEESNPMDSSNPIAKELRNAFSVDSLNQVELAIRNRALDRLRLALRARLGACLYQPRKVTVNHHTYLVHNKWVILEENYKSEQLQDLMDLLEKQGVFNLYTDPKTGLVRTAETLNVLMLRQWFTDGSQNGLMQKSKILRLGKKWS